MKLCLPEPITSTVIGSVYSMTAGVETLCTQMESATAFTELNKAEPFSLNLGFRSSSQRYGGSSSAKANKIPYMAVSVNPQLPAKYPRGNSTMPASFIFFE